MIFPRRGRFRFRFRGFRVLGDPRLAQLLLLGIHRLLRVGEARARVAHLLGRLRALRGGQLERHLAVDLLEVLLQVAHASFTAVVLDERVHGAVAHRCLAVADAAALFGHLLQVRPRDGALLVRDVPAEPHHLHPVQQRRGDGVQHVRRAHEQHFGEVHRDVQVVVQKRAVLFRVQKLEERRRGVALETAAEFVHLVDEHHRVVHARRFQTLHQFTRHRAHVRAPVPLYFRDVAQTADGEAEKLAVQRARDTLADARLANARRAHHGDDLALRGAAQLADGDELQDALLDVVQAVVVRVQHLARLGDVQALLGGVTPRNGREPLQVVARDIELGGTRLEAGELLELLLNGLHRVRGRAVAEGRELVHELLRQRGLVVALHTQLLLDALQLLREEVPALVARDLLLNAAADVRLQLAELHLLLQQHQRGAQALAHVHGVQDLLQRVVVRTAHARGEVRELRRVLEILEPLREVLQRLLGERVHFQQVFDRRHHLVRGGFQDVVVVFQVVRVLIGQVFDANHHRVSAHGVRLAQPAVPKQQERRAAAGVLVGFDFFLPARRSRVRHRLVAVLVRLADVGDADDGLHLRERAHVVHVVRGVPVHVRVVGRGAFVRVARRRRSRGVAPAPKKRAHVCLASLLHLLHLGDEALVRHAHGHDHAGHQRPPVQRHDQHLRVAARVAAGDQNAAARGFALRRGREPTQATTRPRSRVAEVRGTRAGSDVRVAREAPSRRAGERHERIRLPGRGRAPLRRGGAARDRARGLPERRRHRSPCRGHVCRCDFGTKFQSPRESFVDALRHHRPRWTHYAVPRVSQNDTCGGGKSDPRLPWSARARRCARPNGTLPKVSSVAVDRSEKRRVDRSRTKTPSALSEWGS